MNVAASSFRPDLAKKAFESTFELERELRATQKKLPPYASECEFLREKYAATLVLEAYLDMC